eukprot:EG_transcript_14680
MLSGPLLLLLALHQLLTVPIVVVVARGRRQLDRRKTWRHDRPDWRPFERSDAAFGPWEALKLWLCAAFLAPVRLVLIFGSFFTYWALICTLGWMGVTDASHPAPAPIRRLHRWAGRALARLVLLGLGVWTITQSGAAPSDVENSTILSTHASYMDVLVLMAQFNPAFVSKQALGAAFGVGPMARFVCSLFVKQEAGAGQSELIRQRQSAMAAGTARYPPLAVFAEGTTTNNRYLLPFRTGALRTPGRVHLVHLRWGNGCFSPAWEAVPFWVSFLGIMTQWATRVEVQFLGTHDLTDADAADATAVAQRLCQEVSRRTGLEVVQATYRTKLQYFDWVVAQMGLPPRKWD